MKTLLNNFNITKLLISSFLLFLFGMLAFYNFNLYFIITQSIGLFVGVVALSYFFKRPKLIFRLRDVFLLAAFVVLLFPILLDEFNGVAQTIHIFGYQHTNLQTSLKTGLWGVLLSLPYFAHFFNKKNNNNYTKLLTMIILFNMILLLKSDLSFFILFNVIMITAFIVYNPRIKISSIFLTVSIILIFIAITAYKEQFILQNEFTTLKENKLILNSTYTIGESLRNIINNFSMWGEGPRIDTSNYNSYVIQDHILTITNKQFGFIGLVSVIGTFILFFESIISYVFRSKRKPLPIELFGTIFLLFQISIGFIQNSDILPYFPNYGMPFFSYYGINIIVFFIAIAFVFSHYTNKHTVFKFSESKYKSADYSLLSKNRNLNNVGDSVGMIVVYTLLTSFFLFLFIGFGVTMSANKTDNSNKDKGDFKLIKKELYSNNSINKKDFILGRDSILIDSEGTKHNIWYNAGNVLWEYLAVKSSKTGKWGIWNHEGEQVSPFLFDSLKGQVSSVSQMYKPFSDDAEVAHPDFMRGCNTDPDVYNNTFDVISVMKDGKWGIASVDGRIIISCIYDEITNFVEYSDIGDYAVATLNGDKLYIDYYGNTYSQIIPYHIQSTPMDVFLDNLDNGKGVSVIN